MTPQSVGLSGSQLTIGKLSGRRGLQGKLRELGHDLEGEALDAIYRQAIELADRRRRSPTPTCWRSSSSARPRSRQRRARRLERDLVARRQRDRDGHAVGRRRWSAAEATGNGPVNALFRAVDEALQPVLGWHPVLTEYEIKAVSAGEDAQGQVLVRCRRSSDEGPGALVVTGHGLSTNIIEASLEAYLVATNKLHGAEINGVAVAFAVSQRTERGARRGRGAVRAVDYRIAAIPGDGVGPEVVAAARASSTPRPDGSASRSTGRDPRRRRRHRRVRVAIRPEDVEACRAADAVLLGRGRRAEVVRPVGRRPPGAGAVRAARRARAVRQPAPGHGPSRARGLVAAAARAARGRRPADRPRADRRRLLRGARGASGRRRARRASTRCPTPRREIRRIVRLAFELARAAQAADQRRQGERPRDVAAVADGGRRGARDFPDVELGHQLVDSCAMLLDPPAGRLRRDRHREPVRRHPVRRGGGPRRSSRDAAVGVARGAADASTARSGCTSRSTARRRTSPARTSRTRSARSCRRRCCSAGRWAARTRRGAIEAAVPRRSTRAGGPATWPTRTIGTTGSSWSARRPSRRRSSTRSTAAAVGPRMTGPTDRPPGRPLRHDPPRRDPGREHHALARRQAARRADARRVRHAVHRGRLAGLQPQGHRVLRGRPHDALGAGEAGGVRLDPPSRERPATTRTCASWSRPRRRSSRSSARAGCST